MASEAGRAAHAARVIEGLADSTPGDGAGQALEAINQPPGYRVRRPAGPAPKGEGQTRADRAALLTPPIDKGAGTPLLRRDVLRLAALASTGQEEEFAGEGGSLPLWAGAPQDVSVKAVLYARVSTRDKDQDPEVQLRALRPWVAARGWTVAGEYTDKVTGDEARRRRDPPGLSQAMQQLEQHRAKVLVIYSAERLVRSPLGILRIVARVEQMGCHVASLQDGGDLDTTSDMGELHLFLRGWFARMRAREHGVGDTGHAARRRTAGAPAPPPPAP